MRRSDEEKKDGEEMDKANAECVIQAQGVGRNGFKRL